MSKLTDELRALGAQGKTYEEAAQILKRGQGNIRWICWRYDIEHTSREMDRVYKQINTPIRRYSLDEL